jgi:predicted dehydrogenase
MEVYGATGSAITVGSDHIRVRRSADAAEQTIAARPLPAPYADELSYLRAVVLDGLAPQGPGALDTNIIAMEILDAARRSAASGRTIRLSQ